MCGLVSFKPPESPRFPKLPRIVKKGAPWVELRLIVAQMVALTLSDSNVFMGKKPIFQQLFAHFPNEAVSD